MLQLANSHVVVTDIARKEIFPALHGSVSENIEGEEVKVGMCGKARITISHQVSHPLMQVDVVVSPEGEVSGAGREESGECHGELPACCVFGQGKSC